MTTATSDGTLFKWDRWDMADVRLAQNTSLLILQGLPLKSVFSDALLIDPSDAVAKIHPGPFIFLKGEFRLLDNPPRILGVVLARLHKDAADLPEQEVLGALVSIVLAG